MNFKKNGIRYKFKSTAPTPLANIGCKVYRDKKTNVIYTEKGKGRVYVGKIIYYSKNNFVAIK